MDPRPDLLNKSELNRDWKTMALSTLYVFLQGVNLPFIIFFDPTRYGRSRNERFFMAEFAPNLDSRIPDMPFDPSPAGFMLATIVYAFAAGSFYNLHPNDRYRSRFLTGGVAAAILISSSHPMVSLPDPIAFKSWLPGLITLALLLSSASHYINSSWRTRSGEISEDTDEKNPNLGI